MTDTIVYSPVLANYYSEQNPVLFVKQVNFKEKICFYTYSDYVFAADGDYTVAIFRVKKK